MRRQIIFAGIFAALASGGVFADSILEFDIWMQQIDARSQSVLRNLARRDADASAADAREIGRLYKLMEDFYERRGDSYDAALASYVGRGWADDVVQSVGNKDFEKAANAAAEIARDCRNCHIRFKPIGGTTS